MEETINWKVFPYSFNHIFCILFSAMEPENKYSGTWFIIQLQDKIVDMETTML